MSSPGRAAARTIFVFGSNLAGRHGKGDALLARKQHGAIYGQGEGLQGSSYGLPTKDARIQSLPLAEVAKGVARFLAFAREHPELNFQVVAVGCRLAGFTPEQIAPLFRDAPPNCYLHPLFINVLKASGHAVNEAPLPPEEGTQAAAAASQLSLF
jgi:hypothetical protein